jgi:hypothetical protein
MPTKVGHRGGTAPAAQGSASFLGWEMYWKYAREIAPIYGAAARTFNLRVR